MSENTVVGARIAVVLALSGSVACHPATAQGRADGCAPPPAWRQSGAKPGQRDTELAACLKDKAYQARAVHVPIESKVAGVIAQCEVEVDQFEGTMVLGANGSEEERAAIEQRAQQEATAAVAARQGCGGR